MPLLRCDACDYETFERSYLAVGGECPDCEEGELVAATDDDIDEPQPLIRTKVGAGPQLGLAREAARNVLRDAGVTGPPIPVEDLAVTAGLRVVDSDGLGQLSGRLIGNTIEIAPCGRSRRRFVLAHELGHHFMGKPHGSGAHVEQETNAFAGELLVPGPFLHRALEQTTDGPSLAGRFQVSRQVLEIAAKNHNVAAKVVWDA